jgi:hypothetical protein
MDEQLKAIRGAGWHHVNGRFAGYCVRTGARGVELGTRAHDIQNVDNAPAIRQSAGRIAAVLRERERFGAARATATEEPFAGAGPLPWGDLYQPMRELRAAGVTV